MAQEPVNLLISTKDMAKQTTAQREHLFWVDGMRLMAIFAVVWLHTVTALGASFDLAPAHRWIVYVLNSTLRIGVPLFFMLSGYLLLGKQEPLRIFFTKRLNKVVVPLVAWTLVYILWEWQGAGRSPMTWQFWGATLWRALFFPVSFHLWFLYALIGIYLYLPILRVVVQHADEKILYYFIALWIVAVGVIPSALEMTGIEKSILDLHMISGCVGYVVMGYVLGRKEITKGFFYFLPLVAIGCIWLSAAGTFRFIETGQGTNLTNYFTGYLHPAIIVLSAAAFVMCHRLFKAVSPAAGKRLKKTVARLAASSFGIYLVHIIVLHHLCKSALGLGIVNAFARNPLIVTPLIAVIAFTISFFVIFVLQKLPIINKTVP